MQLPLTRTAGISNSFATRPFHTLDTLNFTEPAGQAPVVIGPMTLLIRASNTTWAFWYAIEGDSRSHEHASATKAESGKRSTAQTVDTNCEVMLSSYW